MSENHFNNNNIQEDEIDLLELFNEVKNNLALIIGVTVLGTVLSLVFTLFILKPQYESSSTIYIQPKVVENQLNYNDVLTSQKMAVTYTEIAKSNQVLNQVSPYFTKELDEEKIKDALSVESVQDTQIISISATTFDPELSAKIVNRVVSVFVEEVKQIMEIDNLRVIDVAIPNEQKVAPSNSLNVAIGTVLGMMLGLGIVFLRKMLNRTIQSRQEAESLLGYPVLGEIFLND